jgi:broad specificity phosphatase PhoE
LHYTRRVQDSAPADRRIVLVRHGRSAHVHTGWITAEGFRAWRTAYEAAGISAGERIPAPLAELAERADLVVASDAVRAVASARRLAPEHEVVVAPLLRELDLEGPALGGLRLPLLGWALAVGGRALVLTLRGQYPAAAEAARIGQAAEWLEELAARHSLLVAVTHASFRRRLAARLAQAGWQAEPGRRTVRPWSAWGLRAGVPTMTRTTVAVAGAFATVPLGRPGAAQVPPGRLPKERHPLEVFGLEIYRRGAPGAVT